MFGKITQDIIHPFLLSIFLHFFLFLLLMCIYKEKKVKVFEISFIAMSSKSSIVSKIQFSANSKLKNSPSSYNPGPFIKQESFSTSQKLIEKKEMEENCFSENNGISNGQDDSIYTFSEGPKIIGEFSPRYPFSARRMKKNGKVKVKVFISENGDLISFSILESSGPEFSKAVEEELKQVKFVPAFINGIAVKSYAIIPVKFEIKD